jgi:thiol-disulfide isomerase/thioredoxin
MDLFDKSGVRAPEFPSGLTWLNSDPLSLEHLKGKVVLVDFWTYSCINCQRTLPYLNQWHEKYSDSGLVIIGVHSPEFDFEKDEKNVKEALKKYDVNWPVVMDSDMKIWGSYGNNYWPAKYLINHEGKIIFTHFGEGNYVETELKIQDALREAGFKVPARIGSGEELKFQTGQTPELYFGSFRGNIINIPQDIAIKPNQIYTIGEWKLEPEYIQHARVTNELDDLVVLSYTAKDVFLVMSTESDEQIKVYVTLDGVGLNDSNMGRDVKLDEAGRSYILVKFSTLYHIISTLNFGDHVLRLSTTSDKLRLHAFTFGS